MKYRYLHLVATMALSLWLCFPAWPAPTPSESNEAWKAYLEETRRHRELEIARWQKEMEQATLGNPWSKAYFQAATNLVRAYREAGKYQQALRIGEELLQKYNHVVDTKKALSEALTGKEKNLADSEYATARAYAYQRDDMIFWLGGIYRQLGQREQAALMYALIVQSQPGSALAQKALQRLSQLGWFAVNEKVE